MTTESTWETGDPTRGAYAGRGARGPRPPLSVGERVLAVAEMHLTVYKNVWRGSLIGRFLSPVLFLLSMGLGLGSLVDRSAGGVDGVPYLQFVVPAIVAFQAMMVAMGESTYQVLGYIRWNMGYHAQLASPLGIADLLAGHLLVVAGHMVVATTIFLGVAALFGAFASWMALLCIPVAVLTGMAFAVPVFAFTATQDGDNGFNILFRWVVTPLMLFSGTFFPVDQLPVWMQPVAWVTPLWHGVESCRMVATGQVQWLALLGHLVVLAAFIGAGWWLAMRTFSRRLVT